MNINEGHVCVKGDAMASPALYVLLYMMAVRMHVEKVHLWGGIKLPEFVIESFEHGNGILYVLLSLFAHVKDRTVLARAQHVLEPSVHRPFSFILNRIDLSYLMKRSLASLALRP